MSDFYNAIIRVQGAAKKLLVSGLLLLCSIINLQPVYAQTIPAVNWEKRYGGNLREQAEKVKVTSDGGFIIGGWSFSGKGGSKSEYSNGYADFWLVKTDAAGNILWDKTLGASDGDLLYDILQTTDGGYLVGGSSGSPANGDKTQTYRGAGDFWIVKLNANGDKLWDKTFGGRLWDELQALIQTADGGYMLGGFSSSPAGFEKSQDAKGQSDYWIIKIDAQGNKVWDRTFGSTQGEGLAEVRQTSDGGLLLAGSSNSNKNTDKSENSRGGSDFWLLKTDAHGNKLWDKTYGGNGEDGLTSLVLLPDGNIVIGGHSLSPVSGDKTNFALKPGQQDFWMLKLDPNGTKLWDKSIPDFRGFSYRLIATRDGGFLLGTGTDLGIMGDASHLWKGHYDIWICKLDASGNKVWENIIGSAGPDDLADLKQTPDGGFILAATSGHGAIKETQPGHGEADYWLVKLGADPPVQNPGPIRINYENNCAGSTLNFTSPFTATSDSVRWHFDNPASGALNYSIKASPYHLFSRPGVYAVSLTVYSGGIETVYPVTLNVYQIPQVDLGPDKAFCAGSVFALKNNAGEPGQSHRWNTGDTTAVLNVTNPGTYTLTVGNGSCFTSASITLKAEFCPANFLIPNLITPNQDGRNDKFLIKGILPGSGQLSIYNRWGNLVYQTGNYQNNWPEKPIPDGIYYYFLNLPEYGKTAKGWLEVLK